MNRKPRVWKMWALIEPEQESWGFDVYHKRKEAQRIRCASEKLMRVEVRELKPLKRKERKV